MITKFKTIRVGDRITPIEIDHETDAFVFIESASGGGMRREQKFSSWAQFHPTWSEAHAYLLKRVTNELRSARTMVTSCEERLVRIVAMKP